MSERSPMDVLCDILDEVEGYRRTDQRSHLPEHLIREAKALADTASSAGASSAGASSAGAKVAMLQSTDGLSGRTIHSVFDCDLKRGDMLIYCTDGSFLVLAAEIDGDEAYIQEYSSHGRAQISDYLRPADLAHIGLMTTAEKEQIERDEKLATAKAKAERLIKLAQEAKEELARLGVTA